MWFIHSHLSYHRRRASKGRKTDNTSACQWTAFSFLFKPKQSSIHHIINLESGKPEEKHVGVVSLHRGENLYIIVFPAHIEKHRMCIESPLKAVWLSGFSGVSWLSLPWCAEGTDQVVGEFQVAFWSKESTAQGSHLLQEGHPGQRKLSN